MHKNIILGLSLISLAFSSAHADYAKLLNWRKETYEAIPPTFLLPQENIKVSASGFWSKQTPQKTIDHDISSNSHWACEQLPATITYEYPTERELAQLKIIFYYPDSRTYQFYVESSKDGKRWIKVADWTKNKKPSTRDGFIIPLSPAIKGRFMRIVVTNSTIPASGAHIVETYLMKRGATSVSGLHGAVTTLDRIDSENAVADESQKVWRATAWRNERVNGQISLWADGEVSQVRMSVSDLKGTSGKIDASAIQARFVRTVLGNGGKAYADILDTATELDMPASSYRPIWLTVTVPDFAKAGIYRGQLTVKAAGGTQLQFPLELTVLNAKLPDPKDWKFFLDIWQHPWAIARYYRVKPFSSEHYHLMEPFYRELANAGQKVLTTTITDLPWNHQNFDAYHSMVGHIKNADGTWTQDYSLFDEYVKFGKACGIGPDIHCYTMATWGNRVYYTDGPTGDRVMLTLIPGTQEHEAFWGPFLSDFQKHLAKMGWLGHVYIAMDERGPRELKATADCVRKYAPQLKISMPGNQAPSQFKGIVLENYCQSIGHVNPNFLKEAKERHAKGWITTFYVCCGPDRPNTFTHSPTSEQLWLGYYAAGTRLDGFLRWAFVNWPRDPLFDSSFGNWPAGDTFFLYPGPRSSIRWEMLRDGFEEYEKIRCLRESKVNITELEKLLSTYQFGRDYGLSRDALRAKVYKTRAAVEAASRALR